MSDRTENVFDGSADERQAGDIQPSRFRPRYRSLIHDEVALHDAIKEQAVVLENLFLQVKAGRYRALALTELEASIMWIIKELTS